MILWKLKTDDPAKIASVVAKIDAARNLGEDMFIPDDDDAISYEVVQLNPSALVLQWRDDIRNKFYRKPFFFNRRRRVHRSSRRQRFREVNNLKTRKQDYEIFVGCSKTMGQRYL